MKLKFRADAKDLAIFAVFCVILLYVCAVAVLNLASFSEFGTLYGLNPIEAFTNMKYLLPTLVAFGMVLSI